MCNLLYNHPAPVRILVISDIHANLEALEACLAAAPPHDLVVNLGDLVGYGASPNEVIERVQALGKIFVRGNHDKACSGISSMEGFNPIAGLAVLWTRTMLRQDNLAWLRTLPAGPLPLEGAPGVQLAHGSPLDEEQYLLMLSDAVDSLVQAKAPITFFGHSHIQGGFLLNGNDAAVLRPIFETGDRAEQYEYHLQAYGRYLINPGSIGQPRDGDWRAAFALYDTGSRIVTYHRVPYDVKKTQERIIKADLPQRLARRLAEGR